MSYLVNTPVPATVIDTVKAALIEIAALLEPYKVPLNNMQKRNMRTMSSVREGYARMVSHVAAAHVGSLAREVDPGSLEVMLEYDSNLETIRQLMMKPLELIAEAQVANGVDIMKLADACVVNLQVSRRYNAALDMAMQEIDEWNNRFVRRSNTDMK